MGHTVPSLKNIWQSWFAFRKGKRATKELHEFQYDLERNLKKLYTELNNGTYRHGSYRIFTVCDNKRRAISVAPIRDRVRNSPLRSCCESRKTSVMTAIVARLRMASPRIT